MKKIYLILSLFILAVTAYAQTFEYKSNSPFGIEIFDMVNASNVGLKYAFFDGDGDGDMDLAIMGISNIDTTSVSIQFNINYFLRYQENIGNKTAPMYAPREDKFSLFQYPEKGGFMLPASGDLNSDGLIDFVISAEIDIYDIQYLQFQIQNADGTFTKTNCLDWELPTFSPYSFFVPELVDLDNDGDLDILLGGYYGSLDEEGDNIQVNTYLYAKNIGTPEEPDFLGWFPNPYNLAPDGQSFFTSGDLDLDGDVDLLNLKLEDDIPSLAFVENTASGNEKPTFAEPLVGSFDLPTAQEEEGFLFPSLVDLDGDGDLDLFIPVQGEELFEFRYYENTDCSQSVGQSEAAICFGESYTVNNEIFSESGTYTIETIGADGCKSIIELTLTVSEEINTQLALNGIQITATANALYSYEWLDCATNELITGANEAVLEAQYTGSFAVRITDINGCVVTSDCVYVELSGTENIALQKAVKIYPNPTDGNIYVSNKSQAQLKTIAVYSAKGALLLKEKEMPADGLDLTGNEPGLYLIKLDFGDWHVVRKIVLIN